MPGTLDTAEKKLIKWNRSLSFNINFILMISVLLIMSVSGVIGFISERNSKISEIKEFSNRIAARIVFDLSDPVISHDLTVVKNRIYLEMARRDVFAILIHFQELPRSKLEEPVNIGYIKDSNWKITDFDWSEKDYKKLKQTFYGLRKYFTVGSGNIGRIEIYDTDYFLKYDLSQVVIKITFQTIILSMLILVIIYLSLKKLVINPVMNLNKVVTSFALKDFSIRSTVFSMDELGALSQNINLMAESLQNYNSEIIRQLSTDTLTGLPNRHKILVDIENTECPTLVLINIDFFKEINDFYGNRVGDLVLKEVGSRLIPLQDDYKFKLYRMPADEFALLFDRELEIDELESFVNGISKVVNDKPFILDNSEINVRVTFGAARSREIGSEKIEEKKWSNIATSADMALKKAKKLQKNFIIYKESMEIPKEYETNILWSNRLKEAIKNNKIIPFFQPIVNNISRKPEKYESLVRLIDNKGNFVTPHYFLDIAKKTHLYSEITKVMLDRTIDVVKNSEFEFTMNLTINDILDEEMNMYIKNTIKNNNKISGKLVFEILESEGIENYKEVMVFIEEIKEFGCKIAIDDFGSGYSNFEHILRLSVDYIKIDASLIKNIDIDPNAQVIAKTIANFSKELGLKTISEFVHSKSVYEKGLELGIDFSQGYYFGEPSEFIISKT